jgi:hypothetical protein
VTPQVARIYLGDTVRCTAVAGADVDTSVRWTIRPMAGGSAVLGKLSSDGLYTAPVAMPDTELILLVEAVTSRPVSGQVVIMVMNQHLMPGAYPLRPGPGVRYGFDSYSQDSAGQKISGSERSHTDEVLQSGLSYLTTSDVDMARMAGDSLYVHYQDNGDLQIAFTGADSWSLLPFGSRSTQLFRGSDTTYADGSHRSDTTRALYVGEEAVVLRDGEWLLAEKMRVETKTEVAGGGNYTIAETATTYWFAPALGWFVRVDEWAANNHNGMREEHGSTSRLTSYGRN